MSFINEMNAYNIVHVFGLKNWAEKFPTEKFLFPWDAEKISLFLLAVFVIIFFKHFSRITYSLITIFIVITKFPKIAAFSGSL